MDRALDHRGHDRLPGRLPNRWCSPGQGRSGRSSGSSRTSSGMDRFGSSRSLDRLSEEIEPSDWLELCPTGRPSPSPTGPRASWSPTGPTPSPSPPRRSRFLLEDLPGPVVLVGAQRSPDRPVLRRLHEHGAGGPVRARTRGSGRSSSSCTRGSPTTGSRSIGGPASARCTRAAGTPSDPATVRRSASSRATRSHSRPASDPRIRAAAGLRRARPGRRPALVPPGPRPERAAAFAHGLRGLVIAGTGLGHVSLAHLPWIREAVQRRRRRRHDDPVPRGERRPVRLRHRPRAPQVRGPLRRRPAPRDRLREAPLGPRPFDATRPRSERRCSRTGPGSSSRVTPRTSSHEGGPRGPPAARDGEALLRLPRRALRRTSSRTVTRRLRATGGENHVVDAAAAFQAAEG